MVATLIAAFLVLAFVALRFTGAGDLLFAKLRPRPRDRGEELRPFLILPVIGEEPSARSVPIGAPKSASAVWNTPAPAWHGATHGGNHDDNRDDNRDESPDIVAHDEPLPLPLSQPARVMVREAARAIPVMPLADTPAGATVVFQRPSDHPVQILPGRFKVVAGEPRREDIRFIGQVGTDVRLMIGRNVGEPHEVVTLQSPTVSRRHAQLQFADGYWVISNLSETNPIIVNDETLDRVGRAHRLIDGDRVELGEVMLRFHAQ